MAGVCRCRAGVRIEFCSRDDDMIKSESLLFKVVLVDSSDMFIIAVAL